MYRYQSTTKLIETQSSAIAAAGIKGVKPAVISYWAYWIRIAFSLTIDAQSADGGWMPIPKKLKLDIVKIIKINLSESPVSLVKIMRAVIEENLKTDDAVKLYHDELIKNTKF